MNIEIKDKEQSKEIIKQRMQELNISQNKLAKLTGIGNATISDYLIGKHTLNWSNILKVAKALEIKINFNIKK